MATMMISGERVNAMQRLNAAIVNGTAWQVAKPGCCSLYTAASQRAAEFMLSPALRRQGYVVRPAQ